MASKELTLSDVAEHASKDDLYLVVHDKVYDCGKFVDEHPYVYICLRSTVCRLSSASIRFGSVLQYALATVPFPYRTEEGMALWDGASCHSR